MKNKKSDSPMHSVNLRLIELAEFVILNFEDKPFNTEQLRKALKKKFGLDSRDKVIVSTVITKKNKVKALNCINLRTPLDVLTQVHTIELIDKKKDKKGHTSKRVFKTNLEGIIIQREATLDEVIKEEFKL